MLKCLCQTRRAGVYHLPRHSRLLTACFSNLQIQPEPNYSTSLVDHFEDFDEVNSEDVLVDKSDNPHSRLFVLNRPQTCNALDLTLLKKLSRLFQIYEDHELIRGIFLKGRGDHFCRGRDLFSFHKARKSGEDVLKMGAEWFQAEYSLINKLAHFHIPVISCWNGEVYGSGIGLSIHGPARLATHNATFALNECAYGWYPDGGLTWTLPRMKHEGVGMWLALTGTCLNAWEMKALGVATHIIPYDHAIGHIQLALGENDDGEDFLRRQAALAIEEYEDLDPEPVAIFDHLDNIQTCFGKNRPSLQAIFSTLQKLRSDGKTAPERQWAEKQINTMLQSSLTSLDITFRALREGEQMETIQECLQLEYRISTHLLSKESDFWEGLTSRIEGRPPSWKAGSFSAIDVSGIKKMFEKVPYKLKDELELPFILPKKLEFIAPRGFTWEGGQFYEEHYNQFLVDNTEDARYLDNPHPYYKRRIENLDEGWAPHTIPSPLERMTEAELKKRRQEIENQQQEQEKKSSTQHTTVRSEALQVDKLAASNNKTTRKPLRTPGFARLLGEKEKGNPK